MGLSIWQILIVVVLVILLFGRGKISDLMGDVAQGIKSFRKGLSDEAPEAKDGDARTIEGTATPEAQDAKASETLKQ